MINNTYRKEVYNKMSKVEIKKHPFEYEAIGKLLTALAAPAITSNIVNALYNIVDQIFIGQGIGYIGIGATNISFPIVILCMAIGVMFGIGGASSFSIELGRKKYKKAKNIIGTASSLLVIIGMILCIIIRILLKPMLLLFGATDSILEYAMIYTQITSYGIPFLLLSIGVSPLVRADGNSKYSMMAVITGAVINTILDPLFIFVFDMGIAGAAWATVIGQIASASILLFYFTKFKSVKIETKDFIPDLRIGYRIMILGMSPFIFQFSTLLVQIILNNQLKKYGLVSKYGSDIPIAVSGVVNKINIIFIAIIMGFIQGGQPIIGFNYGAKNYQRVRDITKMLYKRAFITSIIFFVLFQLFPAQIISLFDTGDELYREFSIKYMRIFMMFMFLNGISTLTTTFFATIGKSKKGSILSIAKQIVILIPLLLILPKYFGVYGLIYATPITDILIFILAIILIKHEFDRMPKD